MIFSKKSFFKHTIFFSNTISPRIGGMEMHQNAVKKKVRYTLTRDCGFTFYDKNKIKYNINSLSEIIKLLKKIVKNKNIQFLLFNNLSWIKYIKYIKKELPDFRIIIRSGGNDIFRAPIDDDSIPLVKRQLYIKEIINSYVDTLIVNSDYSYQRNIDFGIYPEKMKKIRGGVSNNIKWYQFTSVYRKFFIKNKYKIENKLILTYAGRFQQFKGIYNFINAIPQNMSDKIFIFLAGDGPTLKEVLSLIKLKKICFCYLGEISNRKILKLLSISDFLINTSELFKRYFGSEFYIHTDTMGRSMMEALSLNVPVIASNVGGIPELFLENSNCGYLIESYNDLFSVLSSLNKKKSVKVQNYTWNNVFLKYSSLFLPSKTNLLVLDLDGTLLNPESDLEKLRKTLIRHKKEYILVINTARPLNSDSIYLSKFLNASYLICSNGLEIYSEGKLFRWNDIDFLRKDVINEVDRCFFEINNTLKGCIIKKTHDHIIQIKTTLDFNEHIFSQLNKVIENTSLEYIANRTYIKIFSKKISKLAALNYVKKDITFNKVYAAGNSLNDIQFIVSADYGWISEDMYEYASSSNLKKFDKNKVGIYLLEEILSNMLFNDSRGN